MKRSFLQRLSLPLAMLAVASLAHAQEFNGVFKGRNYLQTRLGTVVPDPSAPFTFGVATAKPGTVTIPGGATFPLAYRSQDENYGYTRTFTTQAARPTAAPGQGQGFSRRKNREYAPVSLVVSSAADNQNPLDATNRRSILRPLSRLECF